MNELTIYDLLEQFEGVMRAEAWKSGKPFGLQPIQLQMLRYLSRCNRYSNTPAAVTAYFQLTKGTASQSLKSLTEKGYVRREPDPKDGRKVRLFLTEAGEQVLAETMPPPLFQLAENEASADLAERMTDYLRRLQQANRLASFGVCHTCQHFLREGDGWFRCGLTKEPLMLVETSKICREHLPTG